MILYFEFDLNNYACASLFIYVERVGVCRLSIMVMHLISRSFSNLDICKVFTNFESKIDLNSN